MTALRSLLRRLLLWMEPRIPVACPARDRIGEHLRDAIAADARAKANNAQTYEARVEAMIEDFFSLYGDRDGRHHP